MAARFTKAIAFVSQLFALLALLFGGFFLLNVYFRIKVWRSWRVLSEHGVEFAASDIFSGRKLRAVIARYPEHRAEILSYARHMQYAIWMATAFVILIIIFGMALF
ncbi:MAG: hypothetical protein R3330_11600 [Saprospiraceae bacterium]|nr:hypothetical protein [Saprospiraceae bacterium]